MCIRDRASGEGRNTGSTTGFHTTIGTFMGDGMPDTTCVFCGQCVGVCPTNALKPKRQAMLEEGYDPDDIFRQTRRGGKKKRALVGE